METRKDERKDRWMKGRTDGMECREEDPRKKKRNI
jgi:hypothetical protein